MKFHTVSKGNSKTFDVDEIIVLHIDRKGRLTTGESGVQDVTIGVQGYMTGDELYICEDTSTSKVYKLAEMHSQFIAFGRIRGA